MVRLRPCGYQWAVVQELPMFQSHYGAIATIGNVGDSVNCCTFQSHYGAIATLVKLSYDEM